MKNNIVELTKQLITLPSWVDDQTNEAAIGRFIFDYLKRNSSLILEKQSVTKSRYNVTAQKGRSVDTLVVGHLDTVQPSQSWSKNPTQPEVVGNQLFGLGSSDMKSGLAAMLEMATNTNLADNTMFLFYVDEEYDFLGMKKFVKEYASKIKPKRIISLDGSSLSITNGCRGLIEITATIKGKSGHAARPESGVNAITKTSQIINKLNNWLGNYVSAELGPTVSNLAYINGGQYQGQNKDNLVLGKQGNVIPDICMLTIYNRPSRPELTADRVIGLIKDETKKYGVRLLSYSIRHDLGSWLTPKEDIDQRGLTLPFSRADKTGYIDVQMLWQNFGRVPCFTVGAGQASQAHKADEFVEITKLKKLARIINKLITK